MNATSSTIALLVVGAVVLTVGLLMTRAAIRARLAYRHALKTRRRIRGTVTGNLESASEETMVYTPIVRFTDPKTGRQGTFSPAMYASSPKLAAGREVEVLWDERGREPILNVRPFHTGFAGNILFIILALACVVCGALAVYAVVFSASTRG